MAQPGLVPGDEIGGYRLGAVLGAGGLGTVFATTGPTGEPLAIKLVAHGLDASVRTRVAREAQALRRLDHPNVLRLVDAGATDTWSYLVMPRIAGTTLRELVAAGPLLPESAALLVMYAAHGVGAIHGAGLTHRDLKPDNIMLTDDGRVVIIDLGLALAPDWTRQTTEGAIAGSLPYMAPEQIDGDASPACDVWALGVTWWELVTGQRPFGRARAMEEVAAIIAGGRPGISDVDRRIADDAAVVLERCLDKDARRRPANGAALATALAPVVYAGLAGTPPASALHRLVTERPRWESEVAERRAEEARARALELASSGDVFAAVRALDRGLAYRPDDPRLTDALARLMPEGAPPPRAPRPGATAIAVGTPPRPVTADPSAPTELSAAVGPQVATAPASPRALAPTRARRPWVLGLIAAIVVAGGATAAIVLTRSGASAGPSATRYPDTAEGFDRFARDLIRTVTDSREADFAAVARDARLPDPAAYFARVFGPELGGRLAAEYTASSAARLADAWHDLRTVIVHEARATVTTSRHTSPDDDLATGYQVIALRHMRTPVALYRLRLSRPDGDKIYALWSWVNDGGRFRLIGKLKQVEPPDPSAPMAHELDLLGELPMVEARRIMNEWKTR